MIDFPTQHPFIYSGHLSSDMADILYAENGPILPRNLAWILAGTLMATLAFMLIMVGTIGWGPVCIVAIAFIAASIASLVLEMSVTVTEEGVELKHMFRTIVFPADQIIDKRSGALEDIRSYSQWNLKGVSHKSYLRIGDDDGVALKLKGKRVAVISSTDAQSFFDAVPVEKPEDDSRWQVRYSIG